MLLYQDFLPLTSSKSSFSMFFWGLLVLNLTRIIFCLLWFWECKIINCKPNFSYERLNLNKFVLPLKARFHSDFPCKVAQLKILLLFEIPRFLEGLCFPLNQEHVEIVLTHFFRLWKIYLLKIKWEIVISRLKELKKHPVNL